jgi:hypothetical protein
MHRVRHQRPADAAYRVAERRGAELRESHHGQVRAERFGSRQLNQREQPMRLAPQGRPEFQLRRQELQQVRFQQ